MEIEWTKNIYHSITNFFDILKRWFSYYKILRKVYDFDYSSILIVEKYQIKRVRDSIIKYQHHVDWKQDVRWMNIAIKLLEIVEENGCAVTGQTIEVNDILKIHHIDYQLPVYVNVRNASRFINKYAISKLEEPKIGVLIKDNLRIEKAWYLYNKIRYNHLRDWWD